jgi:hypothetical protein
MSYSQANEKYRKYEALVRADPSNSINKRKLEKYRSMAQRLGKGQRGGNNQFVDLYTPKDTDNQPALQSLSQNVSQNASTEDLVNKIHQMLEYTKQKTSMQGGSGKESGKTQIKGHRNMTGGLVIPDFSVKIDDMDKAVEASGLAKPTKDLLTLKTTQTKAIQGITQGVDALKKERDSLKALLEEKKGELVQAQTKEKSNNDELARVKHELELLREALEKLRNTKGRGDASIDARLDSLLREIEAKTKEIEVKEKLLQQAKLNNEIEKRKLLQTIKELEAKLARIDANARAYVTGLDAQHTKDVESYESIIKMYEESMTDLAHRYPELAPVKLINQVGELEDTTYSEPPVDAPGTIPPPSQERDARGITNNVRRPPYTPPTGDGSGPAAPSDGAGPANPSGRASLVNRQNWW